MRTSLFLLALGAGTVALIWPAGTEAQSPASSTTITEADCTAAKLGDSIPVSAIGEPVSAVNLNAPRWNPAAKNGPAYCSVNGAMAPVDKSPTAKPINFQVAFPSSWNGKAVQLGGIGGMAATIPEAYGWSGESVRTRLCDLRKRLRASDRGQIRRSGTWRPQRPWTGTRTRTGRGQRTRRAESRRRLGSE